MVPNANIFTSLQTQQVWTTLNDASSCFATAVFLCYIIVPSSSYFLSQYLFPVLLLFLLFPPPPLLMNCMADRLGGSQKLCLPFHPNWCVGHQHPLWSFLLPSCELGHSLMFCFELQKPAAAVVFFFQQLFWQCCHWDYKMEIGNFYANRRH